MMNKKRKESVESVNSGTKYGTAYNLPPPPARRRPSANMYTEGGI